MAGPKPQIEDRMEDKWRKIERELQHSFSEHIGIDVIADTKSRFYTWTTPPQVSIEPKQDGGNQYCEIVIREDSFGQPLDKVEINLTLLAKRIANYT